MPDGLWTMLHPGTGALRLAAACLLCGWLVAGSLTAAPAPLTVLAPAGDSGSGYSVAPLFSADGRQLVFVSRARNLVTNDDLAPHMDVFVRDLQANRTALVSVNTSGIGGGNDPSGAPAISANGQFIAFESAASNLVAGDTNNASDIFVRDLAAGVTVLASVASSGAAGQGDSRHPLLSSDGRRVFFESKSANLTPEAKSADAVDIFRRDLGAGTTRLVSVSTVGTGALEWNSRTELGSISADGSRVAFVSTRTNLATGITNTFGDVYVRDVDAGLTYRASVQVSTLLGSQAAAYRCFGAVLSADGQTVSFKASILGGSLAGKVWLFRQSLLNGVADVISTNALAVTWPSLSADGRYTAYDALNPAQAGVLVWDAWLQRSDPVIVPANTGPAHSPLLSSDGSTIALVSAATPNPSAAQPVPFQVYAGSRTGTNDRVFNLALITATPGGQPSLTDHEILIPALSPDGTRVAFESTDATLVPNDLNQASDVFLRDLQGQTTQLISRRDPALPARTSTVGLRAADPGCLSADARLLVTTTYDNNFAPDDTNLVAGLVLTDLGLGSNIFLTGTTNDFGWPRLSADGRFLVHGYACHYVLVNPYAPPPYSPVTSYYLRDLAAATSVLASVRYDGTGSAYGGYGPPAISPDGRWVAFASSDSGLVPGSYSTVVRTYARDMLAGTNQVLSRNQAGTFGNDLSADPVFSPDGHWVMFYSKAGNLSPYSPPGAEVNLYARNLDSDELRQISLTDSGTGSLGYLPPARFSVTGQFVVFGTVSNRIYVHDLAGRTNYAVGQGGANPAISASGRLVAAETVGPVPTQIILWDRQTGLSNLVSVNAAGSGGGNGPSTSPLLTANGRYVIFASRASDLVSDDDNGASDIFLRDLVQNVTMLVSRGLSGRPGRGSSLRPLLGPDGSTVVFSSVAPDLVAGDYNDARDVFVLKLGTADSDGDGMDDAWEMAYFGTLARDGTGDFDGDGMTDYQEFLAGTDPTNSNSVLRVFILSSVGNTNVTLLWPGSTNRAYRAQYKETVQPGPWTDLPGQPTVTGGTALQNDPTAPGTGQRFYRVVVGP